MVVQVLINVSYGGFEFSPEFEDVLLEEFIDPEYIKYKHELRSLPRLIKLVTEFGLKKAAASGAEFEIVNVPDFYDYTITKYDGMELVSVQFPWEKLARAYIENNMDDPVRKAVTEQRLLLPAKRS